MAGEKYYLVEFIHTDGTKEKVEFRTNRRDWTIDQWCRNRSIVDYKILNERDLLGGGKSMLLG